MEVDLLARMRLNDRIMRDPRCTPADKEVAWALLWGFCNSETGRCDPSANAIAARSGVYRRHAVRAVQHLERLGYFRIGRLQGTVGKFGPTNTYEPMLDCVDTPEQPRHPMSSMPPGEGRAPTTPQVIQIPDPGAPMTPEPSREPREVEGTLPYADGSSNDPHLSANSERDEKIVRLPLSNGDGTRHPAPKKRLTATPRQNNLSVLKAYWPTSEHLVYLRREFPITAHRWEFELKAMKDSATVCRAFENGERDAPWPSFREWMRREERRAMERQGPRAQRSATDKPRRALIAGTPEAEKAYD